MDFFEGMGNIQMIFGLCIALVTFWAGQKSAARNEGGRMARVEADLRHISETLSRVEESLMADLRKLEAENHAQSVDIAGLRTDIRLLQSDSGEYRHSFSRLHARVDELAQ